MKRPNSVVVVGAGAAGLATAIFARRQNTEMAVTLLDGARRPGAKILVSGGGRCNVTNARVSDCDFWGGRPTLIRRVLKSFGVADTIHFFEQLGVPLHEENDGKLFPNSNRARDVLDALLMEASRVSAQILSAHRVEAITRRGDQFQIATTESVLSAERVVLATGGQSLPKSGSDGGGYRMAQSLGHTVVAPVPALAPLLLDRDDPLHARLSGVAHIVELTVWVEGRVAVRFSGPLLWTHFGVSGPVVLNASRHWARATVEGRRVRITISACPGLSFDEIDHQLTMSARERPKASVVALLGGFVPASVAVAFADAAGISADAVGSQLPRDDRRRLTRVLAELPLPIVDTRGYNYAEATAGGVALDEIDPTTMESRVCPGLYLVGEVLDVDGRLGGFNFQWAWSSAYVAGRAVASLRPQT